MKQPSDYKPGVAEVVGYLALTAFGNVDFRAKTLQRSRVRWATNPRASCMFYLPCR